MSISEDTYSILDTGDIPDMLHLANRYISVPSSWETKESTETENSVTYVLRKGIAGNIDMAGTFLPNTY